MLTIFVAFALSVLPAYLAKSGILPRALSIAVFLVLLITGTATSIMMFFEFLGGIFPASRRRRKELMEACDTVIAAMGGMPETEWKMVSEYVKMRKSIWSFGGAPDAVDPSEFTHAR